MCIISIANNFFTYKDIHFLHVKISNCEVFGCSNLDQCSKFGSSVLDIIKLKCDIPSDLVFFTLCLIVFQHDISLSSNQSILNMFSYIITRMEK